MIIFHFLLAGKSIDGWWLYTLKTDGNIDSYKAQLVAKDT